MKNNVAPIYNTLSWHTNSTIKEINENISLKVRKLSAMHNSQKNIQPQKYASIFPHTCLFSSTDNCSRVSSMLKVVYTKQQSKTTPSRVGYQSGTKGVPRGLPQTLRRDYHSETRSEVWGVVVEMGRWASEIGRESDWICSAKRELEGWKRERKTHWCHFQSDGWLEKKEVKKRGRWRWKNGKKEWIGDMTLYSMHGTVSDEKKGREQSSSSFDRWEKSEGGREGINLFFSSTPVPAYFLSFYAVKIDAPHNLKKKE